MVRALLVWSSLVACAGAQQTLFSGAQDPADPSANGVTYPANNLPNSVARYQFLIDGQVLNGVPMRITEISLANRGGWKQVHRDAFEVRVGLTTVSTINGVFDLNITGPMQTVLSREAHVATYGFGPRWCALGIDAEFWFLPGQNLLIDIVAVNQQQVGSSAWSGLMGSGGAGLQGIFSSAPALPTGGAPISGSSLPAFRFSNDLASIETFGLGCSGATQPAPILGVAGLPAVGGQSTFWLSNALPNGLALLAFGETAAPPFPVELGIIGADGCRQYFPITSTVGITTNPLGVGSHTVDVPNVNALVGSIVLGQYATLAPGANTLGVLTSNYGRIQVGF